MSWKTYLCCSWIYIYIYSHSLPLIPIYSHLFPHTIPFYSRLSQLLFPPVPLIPSYFTIFSLIFHAPPNSFHALPSIIPTFSSYSEMLLHAIPGIIPICFTLIPLISCYHRVTATYFMLFPIFPWFESQHHILQNMFTKHIRMVNMLLCVDGSVSPKIIINIDDHLQICHCGSRWYYTSCWSRRKCRRSQKILFISSSYDM